MKNKSIGLFCIGAPILDKNGNAIAAISISGPTARIKNKDIDRKISRLVEIAKEISFYKYSKLDRKDLYLFYLLINRNGVPGI